VEGAARASNLGPFCLLMEPRMTALSLIDIVGEFAPLLTVSSTGTLRGFSSRKRVDVLAVPPTTLTVG
jgi:hypothetical protein